MSFYFVFVHNTDQCEMFYTLPEACAFAEKMESLGMAVTVEVDFQRVSEELDN